MSFVVPLARALPRAARVLVFVLALSLAGAARAGLIIGGNLVIVPNVVVIPADGPLVLGTHESGFGPTSGLYVDYLLPEAPDPALLYSQSLVHAGGTSFAEAGLRYDLLSAVNPDDTLLIEAVPSTLTLSQTDLDTGTPNDPALLEITLVVPWTYSSASATETLYLDADFDVFSNVATFGATDFVATSACSYEGDHLSVLALTGGGYDPADCLAEPGGIDHGQVFLGSGTTLPQLDPMSPVSASVTTNTRYTTLLQIALQVQNDTGPTTVSLEGFSFQVSEVPEPGAAALLGTGAGAWLAAGRRRRRARR
jgi:hypothetical protein